jgi:hypothetical protein
MNKEVHLANLAQYARTRANDLLRKKGLEKSLVVEAVCLYGGAAKYFLGQRDYIKDYDLQIFFSKGREYKKHDSARFNRRGGIWPVGVYLDKPVELFFGTLINSTTENIIVRLQQYIERNDSDRWKRIKKDPYMVLWPQRKDYLNLSRI